MRQGSFERDKESGDRPVFRLRWLPEPILSDHERSHAQFIRYLISVGRLTDRKDDVSSP